MQSLEPTREDPEPPRPEVRFRSIIGAEQIREIVTMLNCPPFNENLTLFSFDELSIRALRGILYKALADVDPELGDLSPEGKGALGEEAEGETSQRLTEILSLVEYPAYSDSIGADLLRVEGIVEMRRVVYYLLMNLEVCRRRAYLGKFLVDVPVPEEFLMDVEVRKLQGECHELMDYFKEEHEAGRRCEGWESVLANQREDIRQLEREKEQLIIRLKTYQHEGTRSPDFQRILVATSGLRQAQEEEARLAEKLTEQEKMVEAHETRLLMGRQRLATREEKIGGDLSAAELLEKVRGDYRGRLATAEELDRELEQKVRRSGENERKLEAEVPGEGGLKALEAEVLRLRIQVKDLEIRLASGADEEKEERLEIFRQQVDVVQRKAERLDEEVVESEEARVKFEIECQSLKQQLLEKGVGANELEVDDLGAFQARLHDKLGERSRKQDELDRLDREGHVLGRTEKVLEGELKASIRLVRDFEKRVGVEGLCEMEDRLEDLTRQKGQIDQVKGKNLEELSGLVQKMARQISERRGKLQPLVDQQKAIKKETRELEEEHGRKKGEYWGTMQGLKEEFQSLVRAVSEKRQEVFDREVQREQLTEKSRVLSLYLGLMGKEQGYTEQEGPVPSRPEMGQRLSASHRSHGEWMDQRVAQVEECIQRLKKERERLRLEAPKKTAGKRFLEDLIGLMSAKSGVGAQNGGESDTGESLAGQGKGLAQRETFNRLVME